MEIDRRKLKRKPFSDVTNTNTSLNNQIPNNNNIHPNPKKHRSKHLSQPSTPKSTPTLSNSVGGDSDRHLSNTSKVYARRQPAAKDEDTGKVFVDNLRKAKDKGKSVSVEPFSCPPIGRTKSIWDENEQEDDGDMNSRSGNILSKTTTDPRPQIKKRRNSMPALPRDFLEEQRKYFAEVDAFQLEEEIVSENDLE